MIVFTCSMMVSVSLCIWRYIGCVRNIVSSNIPHTDHHSLKENNRYVFIANIHYYQMRAREKAGFQQKIARERISILFKEAAASSDAALARRYMQLAKKIGMRYNVRLGKLKRRFCKNCYSYFSSKNSRIRFKNGTISIKCLSCNSVKRIRYKKS